MKNLFFVGLFSCVIAITQTIAIANDLPTSAEQLRNELETALKAGDIKTVLSLNNWKGVSDEMKSGMSDEMSDLIKQGVSDVKLLPLPSDYEPTNEMDGVRCFSNVHVQGLIEIKSTNDTSIQMSPPGRIEDSSIQIPYGDSDGKFYVAGMVQEVFDLHPKPAVQLSFFTQVLASRGPNSGKFTGSYVYVLQSGREVKKDFKGVGNLSKAFAGLYLKSCTVQASPDNQDKHERIELEIRQDNKIIFDSGKIETNAPIIYEKKN
jgi:hypothetical protein